MTAVTGKRKTKVHSPEPGDLPAPTKHKSGWPWTTSTPGSQNETLQKISIVTPSFNQGKFLEETIRSVLLQGYPNLEYIVIDGGSSDGSVDLIRKYKNHLSYWISEKDGGAADAIAKGFRKATGSIIGWLNSDDVYRPGTLQSVAKAFQSTRDIDVVYGNTQWIDASGNVLAEKRQTPFSKSAYFYGGADLQQPSTFWTRALYEKAGGLDPTFRAAFDTDLFFRFFQHEARFQHIPELLAAFRLHSDQISEVLLETCRQEIATVRSRHLTFPVSSLRGKMIRNFARFERIFRYACQGDLPWLIGRIPDRVKSRFLREATGPKSKWI